MNPTNIEDWLTVASVRAVGGTWIADSAAIGSKDWDEIAKNAADAVAKVKAIRSQPTVENR